MRFAQKSLHLPAENYLGRQIYFVTICCYKRRPHLSNHALAQSIVSELRSSSAQHSFLLHAFCAMPDHLHLLVEGTSGYCDLSRFLNAFKQHTGFGYRKTHCDLLWQQRYYDHILRSPESLEDVACYIWLNPVRKRLCADPRLYPHSGSLTIDWMKRASAGTAWSPSWKTKSSS